MEITPKKFIPGIQHLRGLAALAVVLCHYGSDLQNYRQLSKVFNYGQLGVHVFFFISGYVIVYSLLKNSYQPKSFFTFLLKRSLRIDPPYYFIILLTLFSFWIFKFLPNFRGSGIPFIPGQMLAHIFYVVPFTKWPFYNHIFWTLCVEFQFYVIIGCLYFLNQSTLYRILFLLAFSLTAFIPSDNSFYLATNYAPIFAMGIACMHYFESKEKAFLLSMLFSLTLISVHFGLMITLLIVAAGILLIFNKKTNVALKFLGDISYSLYIIHPLVLIYSTGIIKKLFTSYHQYELLVLLSQLIMAIIAAYLLYITVERPSIRLSKKIKLN
jgi:peptidoglycan/LPS O-acetylase OafA/YrhL